MLEEIKKDLEKLMSFYEKERQRANILQAELEKQKEQNEAYRLRIIDLERKVDNHNLADAFTANDRDNSAAKEKIEKLIREMDRCIALLEK